MKKFNVKSIALGFIIGTLGLTTVFAANDIKSSVFSDTKVTLDGITVPLENSLVAIVENEENNAKLYMPIRELLEYMGYTVDWDGSQNSINLISNFNDPSKIFSDTSPIREVVPVPILWLQTTSYGNSNNVRAGLGGHSWTWNDANGKILSVETDAPHTLEINGFTKIVKKDDMSQIEIAFTMQPDSYTIRRWPDKYIGNALLYAQYYETIDVYNDTITFSDDNSSYVYEIHATWAQGNAYYSFKLD